MAQATECPRQASDCPHEGCDAAPERVDEWVIEADGRRRKALVYFHDDRYCIEYPSGETSSHERADSGRAPPA